MKAILEKLGDETVRIERVILLAGALASYDAFPEDLNDFFEENDAKDVADCLGDIPDYVDLEARRYERSDAITEWLFESGKFGFLVQFATPVMTPCGSNSRSFSWGYYSTKWIYAETIDEAIDKGMTWVKERRLDEDRKANSKSKNGGAA